MKRLALVLILCVLALLLSGCIDFERERTEQAVSLGAEFRAVEEITSSWGKTHYCWVMLDGELLNI